MKVRHKVWTVFLLVLIAMQCVVCMAAGNTGMKVSAPLDNGFISNVEVRFYYLGEKNYPDSFKGCNVERDFDKSTSDKAKKLWEFVAEKKINASYSVKTENKAVSVEKIEAGYYLYGAGDVKINDNTYHFVPAIVFLSNDGTAIELKHTVEKPQTPDKTPTSTPTPTPQNPVTTIPATNPVQQGKLPQTGQNWVLVTVFAGIGVILLGGCLVCAVMKSEDKKRKKKYIVMIISGIACLGIAAYFLANNLEEDDQARENSAEIIEMLREAPQEEDSNLIPEEMEEDEDIGNGSADEMDVIMDGDTAYVGTIVLPKLGIELPVAADLSYPQLRVSPCRYKGTVTGNSMIIAAHNYKSHFGGIKNVKKGDKAQFVDVHGNVYNYEAIETEILKPNDFEGMDSGDWDLTLFTCTIGGAKRVTVRYGLVD